ncbi:hypothetical protein E2C01_052398 [Portunus trituberculatus]|uniref:Uncharacterized protein n=1 Tax=Portunus trituberculatus TaxID=210409 RepID=A0A5B7GP85_PORTR|nr:hypothetical protein [Portunus trituberculatus]
MISIFYTTELETPLLKLQAAPGFPEFVCRECRVAGGGSALPWILPGNEPQLPTLISHPKGSRAVFMPRSQTNVPNSYSFLRLKLFFFFLVSFLPGQCRVSFQAFLRRTFSTFPSPSPPSPFALLILVCGCITTHARCWKLIEIDNMFVRSLWYRVIA